MRDPHQVGRPRKDKAKTTQLALKCDEASANQIKLLAKKKGQTPSEWLRDAAMRHVAFQLMGSL